MKYLGLRSKILLVMLFVFLLSVTLFFGCGVNSDGETDNMVDSNSSQDGSDDGKKDEAEDNSSQDGSDDGKKDEAEDNSSQDGSDDGKKDEAEDNSSQDGQDDINADYEYAEFVWLEEAYENNWLSQDDLKSIAFYYNKGNVDNGDNYGPVAKDPEELDEATKERIIEAYCKKFEIEKELYGEVGFNAYYGTYHECIAVEISTSCEVGGDPVYVPEYELGNVKFYNYYKIGVYKKTNKKW